MNKKIFILFTVILLLLSMTFSASASLGWGDISDLSLYTQEAPIPGKALYYNDIPTDIQLNLYKQPYTLYISLHMGIGSDNLGDTASIYRDDFLGDLENIPYTTITNSPYAQENMYRDVTTMVSFGNPNNNSLKPVQVFVGEVKNDGIYLDVVPRNGYKSEKTWSTYESQFPGQYQIDKTRYRERVEFVLKYQIDPTFVVSNNSWVSFRDYSQYIDLTPYFHNYNTTAMLRTDIVSINVLNVFAIFNKTVKSIYNSGNSNPYHVISSTNIFSFSDSVVDLEFWMQSGMARKYVPLDSYKLVQKYMFTGGSSQRFGISKNLSKIPYYNQPITDKVRGIYYDQSFTFNQDASIYGFSLNGLSLRYGESYVDSSLNPTGTISGSYFSAYRYNVNSTDSCSYLRFSVDLFISYKQDYLFSIIEQENNITGDIDISQFYKSTEFNIEPPADITDIFRPLADFFKQLFVIVLPNIINNFVVWFMCESPLISTVTRPIFLLAHLTYGYVVSWIVPVITSLGIFGGIFFVIFIIKRLIPHLLGGKE